MSMFSKVILRKARYAASYRAEQPRSSGFSPRAKTVKRPVAPGELLDRHLIGEERNPIVERQ